MRACLRAVFAQDKQLCALIVQEAGADLMLTVQGMTSGFRGSCGQGLRMAADALAEVPSQSQQLGRGGMEQTGAAQSFSHCIESHAQSLTTMGQEHHFGLVAHAHGMEAAGHALGSGIATFGRDVNHSAEAHGQSLVNMGHSQQLGLSAHGAGIATAGQSITHGMTTAGKEFNEGITALGNGFADMGRYISKSVTLLTFALIVRAAVDLGFVYIIGAFCMTTVVALLFWNLQLQVRLTQQRWGHQFTQNETRRADGAVQQVAKLDAELAETRSALSAMEMQQNASKADLVAASAKQESTLGELEEARILLMKLSGELSQAQSTGGTGESGRCEDGQVDSALSFLLAQRDAEVTEAHKEIQRVKQELSNALATIASLDGVRAEGSKRRRSRV
jgi:hypothetical protein